MLFDVLDQILATFLSALAGGLSALHSYSLPILAVFALIAWCTRLWGGMLGGESGLSAGFTTVFSIGCWYWVSISLAGMGIAAFDSFTQFGASVGGQGSVASFLVPSQVWGLGWEAAAPLLAYAKRFSGMAVLSGFFQILIAYVSVLVIVLAFGIMALFIMLVQIEFRLALMLAAILIPLGVFQGTAFMAEYGLGLLCGGLIRTFMTTALLAISLPLVRLITPNIAAGTDPTFETAVVMAFVSGCYVALLINGSRKASSLAVRGLGLGLGSSLSLGGMVSAASMALGPAGRVAGAAAGAAIRGGSRLVQSMR